MKAGCGPSRDGKLLPAGVKVVGLDLGVAVDAVEDRRRALVLGAAPDAVVLRTLCALRGIVVGIHVLVSPGVKVPLAVGVLRVVGAELVLGPAPGGLALGELVVPHVVVAAVGDLHVGVSVAIEAREARRAWRVLAPGEVIRRASAARGGIGVCALVVVAPLVDPLRRADGRVLVATVGKL